MGLHPTGTELFLLVAGVALLLAVGGDVVARRYRVPDVLWLVALGVVAGPVLGLVPASTVLLVAPAVGTAVLVIIVFDAGLDLEGKILRPLLASAVVFAVVTYVAGVVIVTVLADAFLFPGDLPLSLFFGAALGASSGAVAIPVANRMGLLPSLRGFVHLDAAIEDALAIVFAGILLLILTPSGTFSTGDLAVAITLPIPVGIAVGVVGGVVWLLTLGRWQDRPFAALATLGYVLLVYGVTKLLLGSGIVAALVVGIVIANAAGVRRLVRWVGASGIHPSVRTVQTEVAFLFRALFLLFMGCLVVLANPGWVAIAVIVGLSVGLLALRFAVARALSQVHRVDLDWASTLGGVGGRGLTSAVVLILPISVIPGAQGLFLPGVLLIVGTDLAMTAWVYAVSRRGGGPTAPGPGGDLAKVQPILEGLAREDGGPARGPGVFDVPDGAPGNAAPTPPNPA